MILTDLFLKAGKSDVSILSDPKVAIITDDDANTPLHIHCTISMIYIKQEVKLPLVYVLLKIKIKQYIIIYVLLVSPYSIYLYNKYC